MSISNTAQRVYLGNLTNPNDVQRLIKYLEDLYKKIAAINNGTITSNTIYFGDAQKNGSWRIRVNNNDLVQEHLEGGVWVQKVAATP